MAIKKNRLDQCSTLRKVRAVNRTQLEPKLTLVFGRRRHGRSLEQMIHVLILLAAAVLVAAAAAVPILRQDDAWRVRGRHRWRHSRQCKLVIGVVAAIPIHRTLGTLFEGDGARTTKTVGASHIVALAVVCAVRVQFSVQRRMVAGVSDGVHVRAAHPFLCVLYRSAPDDQSGRVVDERLRRGGQSRVLLAVLVLATMVLSAGTGTRAESEMMMELVIVQHVMLSSRPRRRAGTRRCWYECPDIPVAAPSSVIRGSNCCLG